MSDAADKKPIDDQIEAKNIANILTKLNAGKVLSANEMEALADFNARQASGEKKRIIDGPADLLAGCTPRKRRFAELVAAGKTNADAWREAYAKTKVSALRAAKEGYKIAVDPRVQAYVAAMRHASTGSTLLSINERLKLLADNARIPSRSAAARNAQARAIEVYNKTAGDQAPERIETTVRGDPSAPLATQQIPWTKADKIAAILARRQARIAAQAAAAAPAPAPAT